MAACLLPQLITTPAVILCLSIYLDSSSSLSLKTMSIETQCKGVYLKSQTVSCPEPARCNHIFEVMAFISKLAVHSLHRGTSQVNCQVKNLVTVFPVSQ